MREIKRRRLETKGWRVGSAKDFLALSDQEAEYIELKLKLAESLRQKRRQRHLGQMNLAKLVKSSQSRVAKMEAADRSVSIDLIIRSLLALGASHPELGRIIAGRTLKWRKALRPFQHSRKEWRKPSAGRGFSGAI